MKHKLSELQDLSSPAISDRGHPVGDDHFVVRALNFRSGHQRVLYVGGDVDAARVLLLRELEFAFDEVSGLVPADELKQLKDAIESLEQSLEDDWAMEIGPYIWSVDKVDSSWYLDAWKTASGGLTMSHHGFDLDVVPAGSEYRWFARGIGSISGVTSSLSEAKEKAFRAFPKVSPDHLIDAVMASSLSKKRAIARTLRFARMHGWDDDMPAYIAHLMYSETPSDDIDRAVLDKVSKYVDR